MSSRKEISDFFTLFFDPKIPFLFILGAIALAVIGNGAYDLLIQIVGSTSISILYIISGALTIILGSTVVLWILFREKLHAYEPPKGIILFVGPGTLRGFKKTVEGVNEEDGMERIVLEQQIKENKNFEFCGLVLIRPHPHERAYELYERTRSKAERLIKWLSPDIYVRFLEVEKRYPDDDVEIAYKAIAQIIDEAKPVVKNAPIAVDITGGTKAMTFGAIKACIETDAQMMYIPIVSQYDDFDFLPPKRLIVTDK
jgi:hypothetical protein